jgi:hypothetical protein
MYVVGGGYTPYSGTKVFWLLYWSVQAAWMTVFPGIVCKAIFGAKNAAFIACLPPARRAGIFKRCPACPPAAGSCMSRVQVATTLVCGAGCFVAPMVTAIRYDMALNNYVVLVCSGERLVPMGSADYCGGRRCPRPPDGDDLLTPSS